LPPRVSATLVTPLFAVAECFAASQQRDVDIEVSTSLNNINYDNSKREDNIHTQLSQQAT